MRAQRALHQKQHGPTRGAGKKTKQPTYVGMQAIFGRRSGLLVFHAHGLCRRLDLLCVVKAILPKILQPLAPRHLPLPREQNLRLLLRLTMEQALLVVLAAENFLAAHGGCGALVLFPRVLLLLLETGVHSRVLLALFVEGRVALAVLPLLHGSKRWGAGVEKRGALEAWSI